MPRADGRAAGPVRLTAEQKRVLRFLSDVAQGRWVSLVDIHHVVFCGEDDDLFVPSLVARDYVEIASSGVQACRITDAGRAALGARAGGSDA